MAAAGSISDKFSMSPCVTMLNGELLDVRAGIARAAHGSVSRLGVVARHVEAVKRACAHEHVRETQRC